MKGRLFETVKPDGEHRLIGLYKHKDKDGYTFVNLTTGNITPCVFETTKDAINDLNDYVLKGKLKSFRELSAQEVATIALKLRENYKGDW